MTESFQGGSSAYRRRDIAALVQDDRVHRDLYLSAELFALEQQHFFANTWLYLGHASQVPAAGDYLAVDIAGRPLLMVRQADESLRVSGRGLVALRHVAVYRDFVFVRIGEEGPGFEAYFGDALRAIDNLADRSPVGRLRIEGGVLRNIIHCNWKMYLENINDAVHPMSAHESATQAARALWQGQAADAPKPIAMEQLLRFGASYESAEQMGGRVLPNGHSVLGTRFSAHSGYAQPAGYEEALREAHGAERAAEVLERSPQNAICFPSLALKGSPQGLSL